LRTLQEQACGLGRWARGEAGLLAFVALAERARRCGSRNPAGLFRWLVENGRREFATQGDEEAARRRLAVSAGRDGRGDAVSALVSEAAAKLAQPPRASSATSAEGRDGPRCWRRDVLARTGRGPRLSARPAERRHEVGRLDPEGSRQLLDGLERR
jgi:hypothetical protein